MTDAAKPARPSRHIYLVDGSGFIFRAFFALKTTMTRADGTPTNAVLGFTNMLMKLLEDAGDALVAVIFDAGAITFRNDIYAEYKANRPPPPDELVPQFGLVRDAVRAFDLPCIEQAGYEADDIIATYARQAREAGTEVTIVSSDKDLMQLVRPGVAMFDPMKGTRIGADEVAAKFGVAPDRVVDVQALAGDSTDNVPGVPGIGVKTAALLINEYGDLEAVLDRAGEIKQPKRRQSLIEYAEQARLSRRLVELKQDVPVETPLDALKEPAPSPERLVAFLKENGFRSILARLGAAAGDAADPQATEIAPAETVYELVQDAAALEAWVARAIAAGVVAFDTETTSLDAMRARLVGFSLSLEAGRACYVPLAHVAPAVQRSLDLAGDGGGGGDAGAPPRQIPLDRALAIMRPMLQDEGVLKVGHNIKYDAEILAHYGIDVAPVDDTMLISYVLEGGLHGHGLDELSRLHLDHENIKFGAVAGTGKNQLGFAEVALDAACDYAAEDADMTGRLHRLLKPRLVSERMTTVYETIERPLIPVVAAMERSGIKVDRAFLSDLSRDFAGRLGRLEQEIHGLAGHPFNIGSPKQLGQVLFDEIGLEGGRKGKTGAYATGAEVLEVLAAQGHELPARVLDWRQLAKLKSTYTDALQVQINPETGRVHTSFAMAVASTGRLSSSDPNLQNIPVRTEEGRKIRHAFVAEAGQVLLSVDYSQIELRVLAHTAGIEALRTAFRDGIDIHALTASQVFGVPVEGMDPMVRRQAKAINFGIIYGISAFGLARQLGVPQADAAAYIKAYFERYPGIRDYMDETKEACRKLGFVETLFGRRCHVPGIKNKNPARRGFAERQAINAPIQGSAADIIKRAMIRMPAALADQGLGARMLLQVHDELLFEVPEAELEATAETARAVMEAAAGPALELSVPLVADIGHGRNWAEAY